MEQKKATQAERRVLKELSKVNTYIRVGDWRRTNCEVLHSTAGLLLEFRQSTFNSLLEKGLIKEKSGRYGLSALGGEAAIKGYYTPGGDIEKREKTLSNLNARPEAIPGNYYEQNID